MRRCFVAVVLTLLSVAASVSALGLDDDELSSSEILPTFTVKTLTESNFEHDTQAATGSTTGDWFVMFGVASCPHCVHAKAAWQEMAKHRSTHRTLIGEVDCDASYWVCSRFAVRSYPTFLLFKSGAYYEYRGTRTVEMFQAWLQGPYLESKVGPVPPELAGLTKLVAIAKEVAKDFDHVAQTMPLLAYGSLGMIVVLTALLTVLCLFCPSAPTKPQKPLATGKAPSALPTKQANVGGGKPGSPPVTKASDETKKKQ